MKQHFKVYLITALISGICLILVCLGISFASEEWQGFTKLAPPEDTYDSQEIITSYEGDDTVNNYTIHAYKEGKEQITRYLDRHKNLISYEIYGYNQNNQKTKCFRYNAANECTHTVTYEYDASGNLLAETTYSADGIGMFRDHYQYDKQNRMLSKTEDTLGGVQQEVVYTFTYSYDEQGRICREDIYAFDELYGYYLYEYDGAIPIRKEHYFVGDSEDRYLSGTEYQYDNSGRLVKEIYDDDHICTGYNTIEYQ